MNSRAAWSAAGGTAATMTGTNAVAWAVGATAAKSTLPLWPAFAFGAMTLGALYVLGAAFSRSWPFHRLSPTPAELLDDCIRLGRDARETLIRERLDSWAAARVAAEWTFRTANLLHEHYPALADEFILATGNENQFSGQALAVRTLAVKLHVLAQARKSLPG